MGRPENCQASVPVLVDVLGSLDKMAAIDPDCKQVKVDSKWNAFAFYTPQGSTNLPGWHSMLFSFMASFTSNNWQPIFAMVKSCAKMAFLRSSSLCYLSSASLPHTRTSSSPSLGKRQLLEASKPSQPVQQ